MAVETSNGGTLITGEHIAIYRLLTLKQGLIAEIRGMKLTRGRSCYSIVKQEFGFKGNKVNVLKQLQDALAKFSKF